MTTEDRDRLQTKVAGPAAAAGMAPQRTSRRRLAVDRATRWLVTAGGLGIILGIVGILAFILIEVWPLTRPAKVTAGRTVPVAGAPFAALVTDEYRSMLVGLTAGGRIRVARAADGSVVEERPLVLPSAMPGPGGDPGAPFAGSEGPAPAAVRRVAAVPGGSDLAAATADGRVALLPVDWSIDFVGEGGDERRVTAEVGDPIVFTLDPTGGPVEVFAAQRDDDGEAAAAGLLTDGTLALVRRTARENLMTGEVTESFERTTGVPPVAPAVLALDRAQGNLFAGTAGGDLVWWSLAGGMLGEPQVHVVGAAVTALALLIGDRSLVVGQADGTLSIWFPVRTEDGEGFRLTRIRDFPRLPGAVEAVWPSMRNKGFVAYGGGTFGLFHSTSERVLWTGPAPVGAPTCLTLAPRADAAMFAEAGRIAELTIVNPHPETTWRSLFGKVWYEGYERPDHSWQSTGGSDDFEPKFSLTPLLVGTLKGTVYSLLLAIPLGVLGAMFVSQFMHPVYQRYVKPTVEIMAALPTVVLGFLAGLWLAPRVERSFPGLLLMFVLLPALVLAAGWLWTRLPRRLRGRFPTGVEALIFVFVCAFGIWLSFELSAPIEAAIFSGSFPQWVRDSFGMTYDQRNAVVVGLAMGFAVIPIIFAISEDAFSNVPKNLVSGSLALGANRWQTVTQVVLPTASPGIFSAIMVGFGRAVGETMIVLMATGNTPIMDWSPFNGFRTLSANIAVEIPEAPVGGTLYRTLFLAALALFLLTFAVNTAAELVRQRLRRRYSQL